MNPKNSNAAENTAFTRRLDEILHDPAVIDAKIAGELAVTLYGLLCDIAKQANRKPWGSDEFNEKLLAAHYLVGKLPLRNFAKELSYDDQIVIRVAAKRWFDHDHSGTEGMLMSRALEQASDIPGKMGSIKRTLDENLTIATCEEVWNSVVKKRRVVSFLTSSHLPLEF